MRQSRRLGHILLGNVHINREVLTTSLGGRCEHKKYNFSSPKHLYLSLSIYKYPITHTLWSSNTPLCFSLLPSFSVGWYRECPHWFLLLDDPGPMGSDHLYHSSGVPPDWGIEDLLPTIMPLLSFMFKKKSL